MSLRTQLGLALLLLAVVPLVGVTLYGYVGSLHAYRQGVAAENEALAASISVRIEAVAEDLSMRIERMRSRPVEGSETPFERARREALATAEARELDALLRAILSATERRAGAIPFALDAEGRLFTPDTDDEAVVRSLGAATGEAPSRPDAADWVVALRPDEETGITIGVARPLGAALQELRRTTARNLALGLALAGLALLGILPLTRRMTRHLAALTEGSERLGRGDLDVQVPVPHSVEFARLAQTFNRMARDLREHQREQIEQERIRKELEIGRRIQADLLPRGPLRSPFAEVGGISEPAREVGGDFFNYFPLRDSEVAVVMGDVSGKGVPAALLMANLQATLRARLSLEPDLAALVDALDRELESEQPLALYVTLFLGVLDGTSGRLRYLNAGHNTQFLKRLEGGIERLSSTGRPPGLYPGGGYEQCEVTLASGDSLFLFTDGIVEAEDESGTPFGMDRLEAVLRIHPGHDLESLIVGVHDTVRAHRGRMEAADDATLLALRRVASGPPS